jgi:hypothetical protein
VKSRVTIFTVKVKIFTFVIGGSVPEHKIFSVAFHLVVLVLALAQKKRIPNSLCSNRGILFFFSPHCQLRTTKIYAKVHIFCSGTLLYISQSQINLRAKGESMGFFLADGSEI